MGEINYSQKVFFNRKTRLIALSVFIGLCLFLLIINLFSLQVINTIKYQERAKEIARRTLTISPPRGNIYDSNYDIPLVYNVESLAVEIIPGEIEPEEREIIFARLAEILDMEVQEIKDKISEEYYSSYTPFEIKRDVLRQKIFYIAEHIEEYPGVTWHSRPIRRYQSSDIMGSIYHIIGYVDYVTQDEYRRLYNMGYKKNSIIGKAGVEKYYDLILRGEDGKIIKTVDAIGKQIGEKDVQIESPVMGNHLILTIDRNIQKLCEQALGERKGSVIVLKPNTGEILALVSYPWYDASIFSSSISLEKFTQMASDEQSPFLNRSIQSSYAPASVFKLILTAAIVEDGVFPITEKINCTGLLRIGNEYKHCWRYSGHGYLDLKGGVANSCNIYFWTVGYEYIGTERILRFAEDFGLGKLTQIDLPGEVSGFLPSPEWKEQEGETPLEKKWTGGDTLNLCIGQGWTQVTPIQIANLIAMIVNKGVVYKPHIVKEIRNGETGELIEKIQPELLHESFISPETFQFIQEAMRGVVTSGTCRYIMTTDAVEVAAKTGTAEMGLESDYHNWFASFAPFQTENPDEQIVLVVMVEAEKDSWEWWGPKAGNCIMQGIFANQTFDEVVKYLNLWYYRTE